MDDIMEKITNHLENCSDGAEILIGLGIVFAGVAVMAFLSQLLTLPQQIRNKRKMAYMSGRAEGRILTSRTDRHEHVTGSGRDKEYHSTYHCMLTYEFDVDGVTYTGSGEGSGAFWQQKHQTICYDPNNPDDNCTLYYYNDKTDTHVLRNVLRIVLWTAISFGVLMLILTAVLGGFSV